MHDMSILFLFTLWLTAIGAGLIDTIAGGGGLITLPVLVLTGLSPALALGTNKFQAMIGEFNASIRFMRHGDIRINTIFSGLVYAAIGAILGAITIHYTHPHLLNKAIPFLTLAVLIYVIFLNRLLKISEHFLISTQTFYRTVGFAIGFYNGFFGPGTGSFWIFAFMFFLGFNLKKATLYGKPFNFTGNFASVFYFMFAGLVNYKIALIMGTGQLIGSYIGSNLVIKKGSEIIRPVFITVVLVLTVSLFIKNYSH